MQASNSCFVAVDPEDDALVALRKTVGEAEVLTIRSCSVRETGVKDDMPTEEKGNLSQVEINYMYVSFNLFIILQKGIEPFTVFRNKIFYHPAAVFF